MWKIRKQQLRTGRMKRVRQRRHGPASRVTPKVQQQLRNQLRAQPDLTLGDLQRQVQKQMRVRLSKSLLRLWLQRVGLRRKKSLHAQEQDTEAGQRRRQA